MRSRCGEWWIAGAPVNGYGPTSTTVYQYHGYHWHGCRQCFPNARDAIISHTQTHPVLRAVLRAALRAADYRINEEGKCEDQTVLPKLKTRTYPHAISYDFESFTTKHSETRSQHRSRMQTRCADFGEHWRHALTRTQAYL